jgi:hypothetical protein
VKRAAPTLGSARLLPEKPGSEWTELRGDLGVFSRSSVILGRARSELGALLGRGADVGPDFSRLLPRSERTEPGGNLGEVFSRSSGILSRVGARMVDPAIEERTWKLASTKVL